MRKPVLAVFLLACLALSTRAQTPDGLSALKTFVKAGFMATNTTEALQAIKTVLHENPEVVFATNQSGWTPMFFAVLGRNTNIVNALLSCQAPVNVTNANGDTPLHFATGVFGGKEVAALLLENRAEVDAVNRRGCTPLHNATLAGRRDVVALMIAHKANVDARDNEGKTPLQFAAICADRPLMELLLANGADVNARDNEGRTPLQSVTRGRDDQYMAELRKESQTVTNFRAPDGSIIMRNAHDEAAKLLFQRGARE